MKGRALGQAEGQAAMVLSLIEERFGPADEAVVNRIDSAASDDLLLWGKRILTAGRIDEVFNGADR